MIIAAPQSLLEVQLPTRSPELLLGEVRPEAATRLRVAREGALDLLDGRTVWSVNSTASGGGVAELVRTTLPYWRGAGIDARWLVLRVSPAYFRLTKRLHNMLHGASGGPRLGLRDRTFFERVARVVAAQAADEIQPRDVVLLHDPLHPLDGRHPASD